MHRKKDSASAKKIHAKINKTKKNGETVEEIIDVEDFDFREEESDEAAHERNSEVEAFEARALLDAMMAPPQPIIERGFSSADTDLLGENEYNRYEVPYRKPGSPPKKVAHAVIVGDTALQFAIPPGEKEETPVIRPLEDIEEFNDFGAPRLRAHTPDGTKMFASRFVDGTFDGEPYRLACFSPPPHNKDKPFWGSEKEVPVFRKDMKEREKKELQKELAEIFSANKAANKERLGREDTSLIKGGTELVIDPASVQIRDGIKTRIPDQNTVMGESAKECYEHFLEKYEDVLSEEMKMVVTRAKDAHLKYQPGDTPDKSGQYRPEWGHLEGFSLTPKSKDPQQKDNLGAMPKWANTEMMIAERTIKWTALHRPEASEKIKAEFKMLLDSEVVDKIDYVATIEENGHTFEIHQKINPLKQWPKFPQPTDTMQTTAIAYSLLSDAPAAAKSEIKRVNKSKKPVVTGGLADRPVDVVEQYAPVDAMELDEPVAEKPVIKKPAPEKLRVKNGDEVMRSHGRDEQKKKREVAKPVVRKHKDEEPIEVNFDRSVMQIVISGVEYDYDNPQNDGRPTGGSGSGWVIEHEGKKYVVTNSHVVENARFITARFANDRDKTYIAKTKCVSYQCDLAVLEIDDASFQASAEPLVLGDMVRHQQKVLVVGFPMAGDEVNFSEGSVARIEVTEYSMSGLDMLAAGITAAINPGNSGGPVFSDGKVVGVAFQGYIHFQGLGFMIPMPIVRHFLEEVFSGKEYRGFPVVPFSLQHMVNPTTAKVCGLKEGQSGVRVKSVHEISKASQQLKTGDVLLEIDGFPISNEGTVNIPGTGKVINMLHVMHSKFIGDTVRFKLIRENQTTHQHETLEVDVELDSIPLDTTRVGPKEHDKPPTYFIYGGVSFEVVTLNYIEEAERSDLEGAYNPLTGVGVNGIAKKVPGQQLIIINDIWSCPQTRGLEGYCNSIVKEVDGKEINNMRELVKALQAPSDKPHVLTLGGGSVIGLPNLTRVEKQIIFGQRSLREDQDRSADLHDTRVTVDAMEIDAPVVAPAPAPKPKIVLPVAKPALTIVKPTPVHAIASTSAILKKVAQLKPVVPSDEDELMPDFEDSEETAPIVVKPVAKQAAKPATRSVVKNGQLTLDDFTGVKHFRDAVDRLEENLGEVDEEDEGIALEDLGEGSDSDSPDEISEASEEKPAPKRRAGFFSALPAPATKRKRDEDEEDKSRDIKRFRAAKK